MFFFFLFIVLVILYSLPLTSTSPHFPLLCVHSSECIGRSGAKNDRAREAGSINQVRSCVRFLYSSTFICDGIVFKLVYGNIYRRIQYLEIYCLFCIKHMGGIIQHDAPHPQCFLPLPLPRIKDKNIHDGQNVYFGRCSVSPLLLLSALSFLTHSLHRFLFLFLTLFLHPLYLYLPLQLSLTTLYLLCRVF